MINRPFHSDLVLEEQINESKLRAYNVGFDQKLFRLDPLVNVIVKVIPEFVLGYYEGALIPITDVVDMLREAAKRVYTTDNYTQRESLVNLYFIFF